MMIDQLEDNKMRRATKGQDCGDMLLAGWLAARTNAFEISNVRDLIGRVHWLRDNEVDVAKFPNVAPPFLSYWMEWDSGDREIGRLGCWCVITDGTDDEAWELAVAVWMDERKPRVVGRARFRCPRDGSPVTEVNPLVLFPDNRIRQRRVVPRDDSLAAEMAARIEARVAASEERAAVAHALVAECEAKADEAHQRVHELDTKILRLFTLPTLLMAHSLLACKNVGTEDHQADPKIRRAFRRRHDGRDRVVFKTLTITPAGSGGGERGQRHDLGDGQTAMHLVRGHFKTFTADRPLFGSRVGTWWWSPAVRGREEAGVVVKDYRISSA